MTFIADLHVHSPYAYATSRYLSLDTLAAWAQIKGIDVLGTGDFTHPAWLAQLEERLVPDGEGFFTLSTPPSQEAFSGFSPQPKRVRFCLSSEVSCLYSYQGKVRKSHHLLYAPNFDIVHKINQALERIGNLAANGRPTLSISARNLLDIVLNVSPEAYLVPAHIWTPWFAILGAKSGYDSVEACFRDLTPYVFALETGLSSDPAMNRHLSQLDDYTLISNSDAHSANKLGREANLFDVPCSYQAMFKAIKTRKGFLGTLEFFPEEGKYYLDGHRQCGLSFTRRETLQQQKRCPKCKRELTIGVKHRVDTLADRSQAKYPLDGPQATHIVPLPEIIAQIIERGVSTKSVQQIYARMIKSFGNEFTLLLHTPLQAIEEQAGASYAQAIQRLREGKVDTTPGFDGQYGIVHLREPTPIPTLFMN